ncbi:hypothetical protein BDQ94DRAFT_29076 [Aspergillus welwitschiae]|uniref:Uncharacterized protein n=1 Tax=Aspergillus welwitschiae TaxID=1341132 RepID=A0A3F3PH68_9EURO|nr:hypothetical protein BDQ94DRAFT_29076 [Aspergillus welwitschiae]RDH26290.1 hypothetical protein BDQ94DRAFT_29076 [Aspergillus welwitschiae]
MVWRRALPLFLAPLSATPHRPRMPGKECPAVTSSMSEFLSYLRFSRSGIFSHVGAFSMLNPQNHGHLRRARACISLAIVAWPLRLYCFGTPAREGILWSSGLVPSL